MNKVGWIFLIVALITGCATKAGKEAEEQRKKAAQTQVELGIGYMNKGDMDVAKSNLDRALELDPDLASAHNAIAIYYEHRGENDRAASHYKKAARLNPEDGAALNNYGAFLCKKGRFADAEEYILKAIALPDYDTPEYAYENLGICAASVDKLDKAEQYFRKALEINNRLPMSLLQMANINFQRRQYMSARAYLQRFESAAKHSAESLWLAVQVEQKLNAKDRVGQYSEQLKAEFPGSEQAKRLMTPLN
ncbi:MAG: type IV pilus biogenesis/stability protein PilW [Gammaproteobacteria bacterium RBG_16_57_12]|nr:MAG: type IV pilus biogenesis/stability protein PilW [Gammaproteobacteria bacterium RBG_16_57_12]